jgi:hypothetical protein
VAILSDATTAIQTLVSFLLAGFVAKVGGNHPTPERSPATFLLMREQTSMYAKKSAIYASAAYPLI